MAVIDFHNHILPPQLIAAREECCRRDPWFGLLYADPKTRLASADDLLEALDAAEVDKAVVFGFAFADQGLCRLCNDYVLDAARQSNGRLVPFSLANPSVGTDGELELRRALEAGACGVGELMPDGQGFVLAPSVLAPMMALARAHGAPVLIHVNEPVGHEYAGKGNQGPREAYALALDFPTNTLVFPHWGAGLPFFELMPEVREALRNVYYDTAASSFLYEDMVYRQVMQWAPSKVLWGSDYPLLRHGPCLKRIRRAGIDSSRLFDLLGGNAQRILGRCRAQE